MPKFVLETVHLAKTLAEICNDKDEGCPIGGGDGTDDWTAFYCPFEKPCDEIIPADWQALEVKDED